MYSIYNKIDKWCDQYFLKTAENVQMYLKDR